jgi:hypothetical protein
VQDDLPPLRGTASGMRRQLRGAVLDDDNGRIDHLADGDEEAGKREQIDGLMEQRQRHGCEQHAKQQNADGSDRRARIAAGTAR